jgi:hypothetical protein
MLGWLTNGLSDLLKLRNGPGPITIVSITDLRIGGDPKMWTRAGFALQPCESSDCKAELCIGGTRFLLGAGHGTTGFAVEWSGAGSRETTHVVGNVTIVSRRPRARDRCLREARTTHPNGVHSLMKVLVLPCSSGLRTHLNATFAALQRDAVFPKRALLGPRKVPDGSVSVLFRTHPEQMDYFQLSDATCESAEARAAHQMRVVYYMLADNVTRAGAAVVHAGATCGEPEPFLSKRVKVDCNASAGLRLGALSFVRPVRVGSSSVRAILRPEKKSQGR